MNLSPNILAKYFVDERALIRTTLITSCPRKTLTPFCLQKKRPENELSPPKQQCIGYLMTYDAIYPLFVLILKLQFFKKKFQGFIISLILVCFRVCLMVNIAQSYLILHFSINCMLP